MSLIYISGNYVFPLFLVFSINLTFAIIVTMPKNLDLQNYPFILLIGKDLKKKKMWTCSQGLFDKKEREGNLHNAISHKAV